MLDKLEAQLEKEFKLIRIKQILLFVSGIISVVTVIALAMAEINIYPVYIILALYSSWVIYKVQNVNLPQKLITELNKNGIKTDFI